MKPRVLFYVQHLLGVGHVKRAAAIARAAAETVDLHVALGGEPVALADFGRATVHQLPSARAEDLSFQVLVDADGRPIDDQWRNLRKMALLDLAATVDPAVLLVEHYPFGRGKFAFELLPLFELMRVKADRRILCSVRDVLVEKGETAKSDKIVRLVRQWFDGVLVHGDAAVIPFAATFPSACKIENLLRYTGYVVDGSDPAAQGLTARDPSAEIVVSIGGGAVGQELLQAALIAAQSGALAPRHWRLLAGNNLAESVFQDLRKQAAGDSRITVERARPDFRALLSRAGLSISQAGYNTVMDILMAGVPALVVPFAAEAESEQLFRAREFERRGLLSVLEEGNMTASSLVDAAGRALARSQVLPGKINLGGARGTAAALAMFAGAA